jgi:hypothetical protein
MMRAPINGSMGPRLRHSAEDWETHRDVLVNYLPPFEDMPGIPFIMGKCAWPDDAAYATLLEYINRRMAKGDVPLNLNATSMMAHAYMYTGDDKYKRWITDYLGAWEERTAGNGGVIPDNIGPGGEIGECMDGKWWGGYYGWRWPHGALTVIEPLITAGLNALLLTGENRWLDLARSQMDYLYEKRIADAEGKPLVPHRHFDAGWTDFRREDTKWPVYIWSVTMDDGDRRRIGRLPDQHLWGAAPEQPGKGNRMDIHPWYHDIAGKNPDFPEETLNANLKAAERRMEEILGDADDIAASDIHHWQDKNPVICEALVQLTLGGSTNIYHGGLMHTQLRYFHGDRPGLPRGVGALVRQIDPEGVTAAFHNTGGSGASFVIQGGCFGEHEITSAQVIVGAARADCARTAAGAARAGGGSGGGSGGVTGRTVPVNGKYLQVDLEPGEGVELRLGMRRFTQKPGYAMPGMKPGDMPAPIRKRQMTP